MTDEGQQTGGSDPVKVEAKRHVARRKRERRELRVAFDTNLLFSGSASDLVSQEATSLISQSKFPDLDIQWYLPDVVRLERQFQMQKCALELLAPLARVQRLLGHNLNITEEILVGRVEEVIAQRQKELGLIALKPEYANLDWNRLVADSAFRRAPFQDGKSEKGFRDALIVESFIHLVNISPKTPKICRVVLVTADILVTTAVRNRITGATNANVLTSLEELRGFINTLVSEVGEAFLASVRPKAEKLFFAVKDESTLFYKERIQERLKEKFALEMAALPAGATHRKNGKWRISPPTFSKKTGQKIHWTSRIKIETEATKGAREKLPTVSSEASIAQANSLLKGLSLTQPTASEGWMSLAGYGGENPLRTSYDPDSVRHTLARLISARTVATHKGTDVYDVVWSVDVTMAHDLRRPSIDDLVHIETIWEAEA